MVKNDVDDILLNFQGSNDQVIIAFVKLLVSKIGSNL